MATTLCGLFDRLVAETEGDKVSIRDLLQIVGARSYGPIILLLGLLQG